MTTSEPTTIAVVGGGLAAHAAAARLLDAGCHVTLVHESSPGATGLWGGYGGVFGPFADPPDPSAGRVGPVAPESSEFRRHRETRWRVLSERRPHHPFTRLGLSRRDVDDRLTQILELLDLSLLERVDDGSVRPGPYGHPATPDVIASSLSALDLSRGMEIGLVACPGLDHWRVDRLAERLDRIDDLWLDVLDFAPFADELDGGHAVRTAVQFEKHWEARADTLVDRLADEARASDLDLLAFPPCIGSTSETHRAIWTRLDDSLPCEIAEWPATRDAVFGWRLDRALRALWDEHDRLTRLSDRATDVSDEGSHLDALQCEQHDPLDVDGVVLATGRWIGGGLPAESPFVEPLTETPLWIEGAPVSNPDVFHPPARLESRPWSDHPLFRAGVAIDGHGRPLDEESSPVYDNVVAAGRMLAGFHPHHDGCALGVDLVAGAEAARHLADHLQHADAP